MHFNKLSEHLFKMVDKLKEFNNTENIWSAIKTLL